ncbi:MAG: Ppx/GppA family phosphatase [Synergistaceae bacterium]|jgi:exopolyphosphatase/guanosine-5'-triphosphate,3'-diphosphate pyrophosphatase|nr:Ppx/GppA family phosphatase [Synergistaceae bacterium]
MDSSSVKAVIDVGTNSVKFFVAARQDGALCELADEVKITRLGEGQGRRGAFGTEAMERTASAVERFARRASAYGTGEIAAVGTQAMRTASNAEEFKSMVRKRCGLDIRVISGDEEASLSFRAASRAMPGKVVVFDVGGGSSEAAFGSDGLLSWQRSVPIGALVLYERFFASSAGPYASDILDACRTFAASEFRAHIGSVLTPPRVRYDCAGVGGTFAALASVSIGERSVAAGRRKAGVQLSRGGIESQIALYASMDCESRKKIPGLEAERADIILPGACIVASLMDLFRFDHLTVSAKGLRHGVMDSIFEASSP